MCVFSASCVCVCVSCCSLDVVSSPVFVFLLGPADLFSQECYCYRCHTFNTHSLFSLQPPPLSSLIYIFLFMYEYLPAIYLPDPPLVFILRTFSLYSCFPKTTDSFFYLLLSSKSLTSTSSFHLLISSTPPPLRQPPPPLHFSSCRQSCFHQTSGGKRPDHQCVCVCAYECMFVLIFQRGSLWYC